MLGWVSPNICFRVFACCLGHEASFQPHYLKLKASKASQQFIYSGSQSNGVKNGGPGESYFIFYSLYLFFRS